MPIVMKSNFQMTDWNPDEDDCILAVRCGDGNGSGNGDDSACIWIVATVTLGYTDFQTSQKRD
jgi:hypothetical protein